MIGKLTGRISYISGDQVIIDVNGVGYIVHTTCSNITNIQLGQLQSFWIYTQVKEGEVTLFGFLTKNEQQIFETLITVQGIGGKVALSILSALTTDMIINAILTQDIAAFQKVSGIGSKLAARIINELKDKKPLFTNSYSLPNTPAINSSLINISLDAASALSNLGFSKADAFKTVNDILKIEEQISFEDLMKKALNQITKL